VIRIGLLALLSLAAAACTTTRSSIRPPYIVNGKSYSEPEIKLLALGRCVAAQSSSVQRSAAQPPHEFTTDGCSIWRDSKWRECCIAHDIEYWCGGTLRRDADIKLRSCVRNNGSSKTNAALMYGGVRIGGARWWPFPWRWGYGYEWPHRRK
jgi:hypothetical protein